MLMERESGHLQLQMRIILVYIFRNIKSYLFNDTTNASSVVNGFYGYSITVGT